MSNDKDLSIHHLMDPLEMLKGALARVELNAFDSPGEISSDACRAAYQLAAALGWCRLFGRKIEERFDGILRADMAVAAATELTGRLRRWTQDVLTLDQRWYAITEPVEADDLCLGPLRLRMKAWAVQVAINEAYLDSWEHAEDPASNRIQAAIHPLLDALESFDSAMQRKQELLCTATETSLLENWRSLLVQPYGESLPWWLDGTLEAVAEQMAERAIDSQPSPEAWARVREAVTPTLSFLDALCEWFGRLKDGFSGTADHRAPGVAPALALEATQEVPPTGPVYRWQVAVPLDQAEWKSRQDTGKAAALEGKVVTVEFILRGQRGTATLEVQITDGPLTLALAPGCLGRLLDKGRTMLHETREREDRLAFPLPVVEAAALVDWTLEIDFARLGLYHLVLRVPLQPPAA